MIGNVVFVVVEAITGRRREAGVNAVVNGVVVAVYGPRDSDGPGDQEHGGKKRQQQDEKSVVRSSGCHG